MKRNWNDTVQRKMNSLDLRQFTNPNFIIGTKLFVKILREPKWAYIFLNGEIHCIDSLRNMAQIKINYAHKTFKASYNVEPHNTVILPRSNRSALAKCMTGTAPIGIETGRYERIPADKWFFFNCAQTVEDEIHVLIQCPLYDDLRSVHFDHCNLHIENVNILEDIDKLSAILTNKIILRESAKVCNNILARRYIFLNSG